MKSFFITALAAAAVVTASPTKTDRELPRRADSVPVVSASGNAFWADGKRFYIRGIDYQPGGSSGDEDALTKPEVCLRDIEKFKELGVNTVRIYMVDNKGDHSECMKALADAGIYLILDANTPKYSINRADPYLSYNGAYLQNVFATIDTFIQYDNLLGFFSGNEVINEVPGTTLSARYVKAVTRDMRNYVKARGYRPVPIGYSAADVAENRMQTAHYFNCGSDEVRSDFFAFNDYSWCSTDFKTAEWDVKVRNFTDYGLPIFLSEYGCIENKRDFGEVEALMSDKMTGVYSGGLMYEYTLEENGYGIVKIDKSGKVQELPEFAAFAKAMKANPPPTGDGNFVSTTHSVPCPTQDEVWDVDPDNIPAMPTEAQKFMDEGAGKPVGMKGPGSQTAGNTGLSKQNSTAGASSGKDGDSAIGRVDLGLGAVFLTGATLAFTLVGTLVL